MKKRIWLLPLIFLWLLLPPAFCPAAEPEVKFVDVDTLKGMLGDPNLLIIDARHGAEWTKSNQKIKGAMRLSPEGMLLGVPCCRRIEKSSCTAPDPVNIPAPGWRGN
jgi:hypothetical protein